MDRASRSRRAVRSEISSSVATSAAVTRPLLWSMRRMATPPVGAHHSILTANPAIW